MALFRRKTAKNPTPVQQPEQILLELIDNVPWMGEEPFETSFTRKPPTHILDDLGYIRRVLLSWLCGRPVSDIARRAGCGERSVRNVVSEVIYVREEDLESGWAHWCELGLVGGLLTNPGQDNQDVRTSLTDYQVTVACQICHRVAGNVYMPTSYLESSERLVDIHALASGILLFDSPYKRDLARIQGHLLCHFALEKDPIPAAWISQHFWLRLKLKQYGFVSSERGMTSHFRQHYSTYVSIDAISVLGEFVNNGSPMLRPVIQGRELSIEGARRRWQKMLTPGR